MSTQHRRLKDLEARERGSSWGPYVWIKEGQSPEEALAAAGLPADADAEFFSWRAAQ